MAVSAGMDNPKVVSGDYFTAPISDARNGYTRTLHLPDVDISGLSISLIPAVSRFSFVG